MQIYLIRVHTPFSIIVLRALEIEIYLSIESPPLASFLARYLPCALECNLFLLDYILRTL